LGWRRRYAFDVFPSPSRPPERNHHDHRQDLSRTETTPRRDLQVGPDDKIVTVLQLMRDKRVRAVLVIEAERSKSIVTQGDCAIKVLFLAWTQRASLSKTS
jgi:CBS-domain-containing membrane protein